MLQMEPIGFTKTWNIREALSILIHRKIIRKISQYFNPAPMLGVPFRLAQTILNGSIAMHWW
jgi:hypothetical protein